MNDTLEAERPVKTEAPALKFLPATTRCEYADLSRTYRHIVVADDVTLADIKRPAFWRQKVAAISPGDLLDVVSKDFSLDVQLRVTGKEPGLLFVRVLRAYERTEQAAIPVKETEALGEVPENYLVNHAPKTGWRVFTKEPSVELERNLKSKGDAINWAIAHAKRAAGE
jgi:hypothetical protein